MLILFRSAIPTEAVTRIASPPARSANARLISAPLAASLMFALSLASACDDTSPSEPRSDAATDAGDAQGGADGDAPLLDVATETSASTDGSDLSDATGGAPAQQALAWVLHLLNGPPSEITAAAVAPHFSPSVLLTLPAPALAQTLRETADELRPFTLLGTTPQRSGLIAELRAKDGVHLRLFVTVESPASTLAGLVLQPAPDLDPDLGSFAAVSTRFRVAAARTAISLSSIEGSGAASDLACRTLEARAGDEAFPLGSLFKLYVLGAVVARVERGQASWTDTFPIAEQWKSLPSGVLQNTLAGTLVSINEAADKMISISDNTATDHLIHWLGRTEVEAQQTLMGHTRPALNIPFLTTRDMFTLKLALSPTERQDYIAASATERRRLLEDVIASTPVPDDLETRITAWTSPRDIDTIEWFASTADVCRAFATLAAKADHPAAAPALRALALNPGVPVDRGAFTYVGFKGGSEPGVLTFSWLLRRRTDNAWRVVTVMAADPARSVLTLTTLYFAQATIALAGR